MLDGMTDAIINKFNQGVAKSATLIALLCAAVISASSISYAQKQEKGYYKNGQVKWEGEYKEAKRHGVWMYYYESGKLSSQRNWEEGKAEGVWKFYYEDGQIEADQFFKNGAP